MSYRTAVSSAFALIVALGFGVGAVALPGSVDGTLRDAVERPAVDFADGTLGFMLTTPAFGFHLGVLGGGETNGALHPDGGASLLSWQTLVGLGSLDRAGANEILPIGIEDLGFSGAESLSVSFLASGAITQGELQGHSAPARRPESTRLRNPRRTH